MLRVAFNASYPSFCVGRHIDDMIDESDRAVRNVKCFLSFVVQLKVVILAILGPRRPSE